MVAGIEIKIINMLNRFTMTRSLNYAVGGREGLSMELKQFAKPPELLADKLKQWSSGKESMTKEACIHVCGALTQARHHMLTTMAPQ